MAKHLVRLYQIDIDRMNWSPIDGLPGVYEKLLAADPTTGSITRYLRVDAGSEIPAGREERWDESYVVEGSYRCDDDLFTKGSYVCRRPGATRPPLSTTDGFTLFQVLDLDAELDKPEVKLTGSQIETMPWATASRGDPKHREKILASDASGSLTRLLEIDPGGDTTELDDHDHNEEVLILQGGCKNGEEFHPAGTYTFNPPHAKHGPFLVDELLVCFEVKNRP